MPGGALVDERGSGWSVDGEQDVLALRVEDARVTSDAYPLALARLWAALSCPGMGDVLVSAEPGYELVDWGGAAHIGGGSHASLHRGDSLGALVACGVEANGTRRSPERWSLEDLAPMILEHYSVPS